MNRQEKLEQLRQTLKGINMLISEAKEKIYREEMLPIIESTTEHKMKITKCFDEWCDVSFDLGDWHKEFGLDFTIRLNGDKQVEISHGMLSCISKEKRPYIIERDRIIGKLWHYENEMQKVFDDIRHAQNELYETFWKVEKEISAIEIAIQEEEKKHYLELTKVGSKWVYRWENEHKRPMTIEKITEKLVFFNRKYSSLGDNSTRMKITEWVKSLKNGDIVAYEEEKAE